MLPDLIRAFMQKVESGEIEVYNEFSLQHELGIHLRRRLAGRKVQFERNVSGYFPDKRAFTKREIDICVLGADGTQPELAVELKYPRNGQHPEQMYHFCKDVAFAEELKRAGFAETAVLILADDHLFREGSGDGIYGFFRGARPLSGSIPKPTGTQGGEVTIRGSYDVRWQPLANGSAYTLIVAD